VVDVGCGTCPDVELRSWSVRVRPRGESAGALARRLRGSPVPVVARVEDDCVVLDLRTVFDDEDDALARALADALAGAQRNGV
jgi:L-seryl-tRNA(Ser) seleniumtransferase